MARQIAIVVLTASIAFVMSACGNQNPVQPSAMGDAAPLTSNSMQSRAASQGAAAHSEQLVFSGQTDDGLIGFWIWCEVESNNPYAEECNGSMSFRAQGITKHVEDVEDGITETGDDLYRIMVHSTTDSSVACTLENSAPVSHGPHNVVSISCSAPAVGGISHSAVVNVTGPSE